MHEGGSTGQQYLRVSHLCEAGHHHQQSLPRSCSLNLRRLSADDFKAEELPEAEGIPVPQGSAGRNFLHGRRSETTMSFPDETIR
jgi:hypothetical protein